MRNKVIIYGIILLSIFLLSVGLTYAYFELYVAGNTEATEVEVSVGMLRVLYTDEMAISAYGIEPGWSEVKTVKVKNTSTQKMYYSLVWSDLINEITNDELVVSGICTSDIGSCSDITQKPVSETEKIISNVGIEIDEEHTYVITISFIETSSEQNYNQNKSFSGKITVEEYIPPWYNRCTENSANLRCKMVYAEINNGLNAYADNVASTYVTSSTGINFALESSDTNGKGLYYTTDLSKTEDSERVYYYRGAVTNNYLIFGGYCWRIVRTVEDGSVRLRYGGIPTEGACPQTGTSVSIATAKFNNSYNDNAYVGYMYGTTGSSTYAATHINTNQSNIKKVIDAWYTGGTTSEQECNSVDCDFTSLSTKLIDYSSLIADTPYCSDRSIGTGGTVDSVTYTELGYGTNNTLYGAARRIATRGPDGILWGSANAIPAYKCQQNNDKFTLKVDKGGISGKGNNSLDYPIGLLTADEASYAGLTYTFSNSTNYLYTNTYYWLMTPSNYNSSGSFVFKVDMFGYIAKSIFTYTDHQVLPAISLKSSVAVTSGTGTYNNPYAIQ